MYCYSAFFLPSSFSIFNIKDSHCFIERDTLSQEAAGAKTKLTPFVLEHHIPPVGGGLQADDVAVDEPEVVEDAPKGAKVIKVKDASKFKKPYGTLNAGAKADLSDLPNFNVLGYVTDFVQKDDVWEVSLQYPLRAPVKAGTAVRESGFFLRSGFILHLQRIRSTRLLKREVLYAPVRDRLPKQVGFRTFLAGRQKKDPLSPPDNRAEYTVRRLCPASDRRSCWRRNTKRGSV